MTLGKACLSGEFTESGQCCSLCPVGFGVEVPCGKEDTKCAPCPQGKHLEYNVTIFSPAHISHPFLEANFKCADT